MSSRAGAGGCTYVWGGAYRTGRRCGDTVLAKGWCALHYFRERNGTDMDREPSRHQSRGNGVDEATLEAPDYGGALVGADGWPSHLAYAADVADGRIVSSKALLARCALTLDEHTRGYVEETSFGETQRFVWRPEAVRGRFRFIARCPHPKGKWAERGERIVLRPWQRFFVAEAFGWVSEDDPRVRRFREAILFIARKNGKALKLDTPVLTTVGWKTMGNIREGDHVFGLDGRPTRVVVAHDVTTDRECYRLSFDCGEQIVACEDHQWLTQSKNERLRENRIEEGSASCSVEGCGDRAKVINPADYGRPLCQRHLIRWKKYGDEHFTKRAAPSREEADEILRLYEASRNRLSGWRGNFAEVARHTGFSASLIARIVRNKGLAPRREFALSGGFESVKRTADIVSTIRTGGAKSYSNHRIRLAGPIKCPDKMVLSIPPYVLGAWLGDGTAESGTITNHTDDIEIIEQCEAAGARVGSRGFYKPMSPKTGTIRIVGLTQAIRACGLYGNKHIPRDYQQASYADRLELMRGIMDTDGTVDPSPCDSRMVSVTTVSVRLRDDYAELIRGMGLKLKNGYLRGKKTTARDAYTLRFNAGNTLVFHLSRKRNRLMGRKSPDLKARGSSHYITRAVPVGKVPVRCITVDAPNGMFLAGKSLIPTHNSTLAACLGLYEAGWGDAGSETYVAATKAEQSGYLWDIAEAMIDRMPRRMAASYKVTSEKIEGRRGIFKALPGKARTQDSLNPSLAILDEAAAIVDANQIHVLESAMGARDGPLALFLTTAQPVRNTLFRSRYRLAKRELLEGRPRASAFAMLYELDKVDEVDDPNAWIKANPNIEESVSRRSLGTSLERSRENPREHGLTLCKSFNIWAQHETAWLPIEQWNACAGEIVPDGPAYVGLDLAENRDLAGACTIWANGAGRYSVEWRFWTPRVSLDLYPPDDRAVLEAAEGEGVLEILETPTVPYEVVREYLKGIYETHDVRKIGADPAFAKRLTIELEELGYPVLRVPQSSVRLTDPIQLVEDWVVTGALSHAGYGILRWMMNNVVATTFESGLVRLGKPKGEPHRKIDGLAALVTAAACVDFSEHAFAISDLDIVDLDDDDDEYDEADLFYVE